MSKYLPKTWYEIRLVAKTRHEEVHRFPRKSKAIAYAMRRAYRYPKCTLYVGNRYLSTLFTYRFLETLWDELG